MTTEDVIKIGLMAITSLFSGFVTVVVVVWKIGYRLGRIERQNEWQSRTLTMTAVQSGTLPPPREKLVTLTEVDNEDNLP